MSFSCVGEPVEQQIAPKESRLNSSRLEGNLIEVLPAACTPTFISPCELLPRSPSHRAQHSSSRPCCKANAWCDKSRKGGQISRSENAGNAGSVSSFKPDTAWSPWTGLEFLGFGMTIPSLWQEYKRRPHARLRVLDEDHQFLCFCLPIYLRVTARRE